MTLEQLLSYDDETKLRIIESLSDLDQRKLNNAVQYIKSYDEDLNHEDGALEQIKQLVRDNEQMHLDARIEARCIRHVNIARLIMLTRMNER